MSIYCSRTNIGPIDEEGPDFADPGQVIHYPNNDLSQVDDAWPKARVGTDHIPAWCDRPGGSYDEDRELAPWLRLGIYDGDHVIQVLIDEGAALSLASDLVAWATTPKTRSLT